MLDKDKLKFVGKFIGVFKIVKIESVKRKTYLGREVVEVEFGTGAKEEYPAEDLNGITTDKGVDLTELRILKVQLIAPKLLGILVDSEVPLDDPTGINIPYVLQTVLPDSIQDNTKKAYGKLFGKDYNDVTLMDIDSILKKDDKSKATNKKNTDGATSK